MKIATSWRFGGKDKPDGVLTRDEYHESKKGACDHTVQAVVAQGENIGATRWVCVSKDGTCPVHGVSSQYVGESPQAKAARLKREAGVRLELKRRRAIFEAIREKARRERSLDLADYRLITCEFFQRLHFDTAKQFVMLNGYVTPAIAKQRKVEPTGADNGNDYAKYFEKLVGNADLKRLGAWLLGLALIQHRDHAPYSYAGDKTVRDPLLETAKRWGANTQPVDSSHEKEPKSGRPKKKRKAKHQQEGQKKLTKLGVEGQVDQRAALPPSLSSQEEDTAMTILRKPIKRELPERVAHRQMVVELHPSFVRFREKHSRTAWDISWESVYWKAAEIQARKQRAERVRGWNNSA